VLEVSHVPVAAYEVATSPVHVAAGGVVQVSPPQSGKHDAVAALQNPVPHGVSVGAYEQVGTPLVEPHVPGDAYVRSVLPVHVAAGGVVHEVSVHGSAHRPVLGSHVWFDAVQSVGVAA